MTQEDKKLLLQDLSARLSHGVIVSTPKGNGHLCSINQTIFGNEYGVNIEATKRDYFNDNKCDIKPYLRPMSNMSEEEKKEYTSFVFEQPFLQKDKIIGLGSVPMCINWLNMHHFDYCGLIEKGIAIAVTEKNNPYKD